MASICLGLNVLMLSGRRVGGYVLKSPHFA